MSERSILFIGDYSSIHLRLLISKMKDKYPHFRLDVLDVSGKPVSHCNSIDNLYRFEYLYKYDWIVKRFKSIAWFVTVAIWYFRRKDKNKYNSLQLHYVSTFHIYSKLFYKLCSLKQTAVVWGSDLYKCDNPSALTKIVKYLGNVNCSTGEVKKRLEEIVFSNNTHVNITNIRFGVMGLEHLSGHFKKENKNKNKNKIKVVLGYNASENQQHLEIINSLRKFKFDNCEFVLPMGYGKSELYMNKVRCLLADSELKYKIIEEHLNETQMVELIRSTDVFVQLQKTDVLSAAMQEQLYAGNYVITGNWLPYSVLDDKGIFYDKIQDTKEIGVKLEKIIKNKSYQLSKDKIEHNKKIIWDLSSFDKVISDWAFL